MSLQKKQRTAAIQKSLETRDRFPISYFDSRKYIQHNVVLGDGLGPILEFMDSLPADRTKVEVTHAFEDGDFSFALAAYELGDWGPMVGFEVHRWEDDRIVEHWDNLQSAPATLNPSGRSMTDGDTRLVDLDRTAVNKASVARYVEERLIGGAPRSGLIHHGMVQHHPDIADGGEMLTAWLARGIVDYEVLHKVLGEGNFVLTIVEGKMLDQDGSTRDAAFYDLFRVADNVIVEQWNVTETIAPRDTWANANGKF